MKYDYVIIGGGSGACTLASRLSENPNTSVVMIEAGGEAKTPFVTIPFAGAFTIPYTLHNWSYSTVPQVGLNGRKGYQPRGKVLGGSSAINAMIYTRGQVEDFDGWGDEAWSFEKVLPYFIKAENNQRLNDAFHGNEGPLSVSDVVSPHQASLAFVQAAKSQGYPANDDFNGQLQEGVGLYQVTQKNGQRCSAADAYIKPFLDRKNLKVMCKTHALKLIMDGKRCLGVEVRHKREKLSIMANKEVILAAGAFGSPQLLLLSGIGPADELQRHGIRPVHILPGVGENLHDHPDFVQTYVSKNPDLMAFTPRGLWKMCKGYLEYRRSRSGLLTTNFAEAGGFLRSDDSVDRPDIQLHFIPGILDDHARKIHLKYGISCHVCVLRPKSRGNLRLASSDPMKAPLIDPAFFTDPADIDVMLRGYKITKAIVERTELSPYREKELYPASGEDDESIIELLRQRSDTIYHPVGSCKMGVDDMAVVDFQLRVHGIENLRVVDASIMPAVVSANTNAATIMIAEKAADMIRTAQ